jgi:allantoinase
MSVPWPGGDSLLIRGGLLVHPLGIQRADVRIAGGRIAEVGPELAPDGEAQLDTSGLHVLPGVIDAHSHQWEDGTAGRPDFRDDTASAAAGGITTILDHPLTPPEVLTTQRLQDKAALGERTSFVDFGLHAGASPDRLDALPEMWDAGATSFKVFTCDTGVPMKGFLTRREQRAVLQLVHGLDAIAIVHAEDQQVLDRNRKRLRLEGATDPSNYGEWRTVEAEFAALKTVLALAADVGARVYFVHTSLPEGVDAVTEARNRGQPAYVETCPHYLTFTSDDVRARGHWVTTAPPVRDESRRDGLRERLARDVDVVGSDHGSVMPERKKGDLFSGQPGLPGNEFMVPLLLDLVAQGHVPLTRIPVLFSENPARLFGLRGRKGAIEVGLDGDLTIVDLSGVTDVASEGLVSVAGWSPYQGMRLRGRVVATVIRGRIVAHGGSPVIEPGFGRWIRRDGPPQATFAG